MLALADWVLRYPLGQRYLDYGADDGTGGSMSEEPVKHLFSYGTLRPGCRNEFVARRCGLTPVYDGITTGAIYTYTFGGVPYYKRDVAGFVRGHLYKLPDNPVEALNILDNFERQYHRITVHVRPVPEECIAHVPAYVYEHKHSVDGMERILSGDFLDI